MIIGRVSFVAFLFNPLWSWFFWLSFSSSSSSDFKDIPEFESLSESLLSLLFLCFVFLTFFYYIFTSSSDSDFSSSNLNWYLPFVSTVVIFITLTLFSFFKNIEMSLFLSFPSILLKSLLLSNPIKSLDDNIFEYAYFSSFLDLEDAYMEFYWWIEFSCLDDVEGLLFFSVMFFDDLLKWSCDFYF